MERRKFLIASGMTVLGGRAVANLQRPTVGIEFKISGTPNKDPSNVNSLLIDFESFNMTQLYLDTSEKLEIEIKIQLEDIETKTINKKIDITNEKRVKKSDIQSELPVLIEGINTQKESITGKVTITVIHPSVDEEQYEQSFRIAKNTVIIQDFESGSLDSSYAGETGSYNVTDNWSYNGKYSLRGSGNPVEIFSNSGLPTYPQRGDTIRIIIHLNHVPQDTWCDPGVGFYFGGDSINNCYRAQQTVWPDPETNSLGVSLINTGGASSESSDNVPSYDSGDVISWEIEFGDPEITLKTYTGAWKTLEKQISISDSNYNGTGIGFRVNTSCSNRNTEADFDYIHVN